MRRKTGTKRRTHSRALCAATGVMKEMNERIDREVERWARRLLIRDGGRVRKLTEEEIRIAVGRKAPRRR